MLDIRERHVSLWKPHVSLWRNVTAWLWSGWRSINSRAATLKLIAFSLFVTTILNYTSLKYGGLRGINDDPIIWGGICIIVFFVARWAYMLSMEAHFTRMTIDVIEKQLSLVSVTIQHVREEREDTNHKSDPVVVAPSSRRARGSNH